MVIITTNLDFTTFTLQQIHFKDILLIFAMLFWALDNNLSRYLAQKMDIANIVQIKSAIGGVILFVICIIGIQSKYQHRSRPDNSNLDAWFYWFCSITLFFLTGVKENRHRKNNHYIFNVFNIWSCCIFYIFGRTNWSTPGCCGSNYDIGSVSGK